MFNLITKPDYLRVSGSPYDVGYAQGQACDQLIWHTFRLSRTSHLMKDQEGLRQELNRLVAETESRFPEEIEEIQGIADGSGLDFLQAFLINRHLGRAVGCTAMAVTSSVLGPVATANLDDTPIYFMKDASVTGQHRYIVTTWPGTLGGGNGINEFGLTLVGSSASLKFGEAPPKPAYLTDDFAIASRVLRSCKNVDEAVEFIKRPDIGGHGNMILVDASGKAVCVEKRANDLVAIREPDEKGFIFSLNYFASEFDTPEKLKEIGDNNIDRLNAIQRHAESLNAENGYDILKAAIKDTSAKVSDWPISNAGTVISTIMLPARAGVLVCDGPPHISQYFPYTLIGEWADNNPADWEGICNN